MDAKGLKALAAATPLGAKTISIATADGAIEVDIRPVPPARIVEVAARFPEAAPGLRIFMLGAPPDATKDQVKEALSDMIVAIPRAYAGILCCGMGEAPTDENIDAVLGLTTAVVTTIGSEVAKATMPEGIGRFFIDTIIKSILTTDQTSGTVTTET